MHKLIRFYSQNKKRIWVILGGIICIFIILQILNYFARLNIENRKKEAEKEVGNTTVYNPSESIISDNDVPETYAQDFEKTISTFLDYCITQNPEQAYNMLTKDCKETLFPTLDYFKTAYYNNVFSINKIYNFQSWTTDNNYIYKVRILDNILSSGTYSNVEAIEDYYTLIKEDGEYKLSINSYIGKKFINKQERQGDFRVIVSYADVYVDNEIYHVILENYTGKTVLLDPQVHTNGIYLMDTNKIQYSALVHELVEDQLIIENQKTKRIQIKFNDSYGVSRKVKQITFSNIVLDYDSYKQKEDKKNDKNFAKMTVDFQ